MPSLNQHPRRKTTKVMIVGDPGAGKTALLASLANAGYKVNVFDFDHGVDAIMPFCNEGIADTISYVDLSEDDNSELAFVKFKEYVHKKWKIGDEDLGKPSDWDDNTVLVVDSLTIMSEAAKRVALHKKSKTASDQLDLADWGTAQRLVTAELSYLMSSSISCNVIVLSHMSTIDEDGSGLSKYYPASCGKSISMLVGRYFNNVWRLDNKVRAGEVSRTLRVVSDNRMTLKNSAPHLLKKDEEPDLARLFKIIQQGE